MKLNDGPAHECVGRQRVAAVPAAIDHEHAVARPGEQHRRGRAGASRADDDDVVRECGFQRHRGSAGVDGH